jgi:glycosyltransferase involved in cell wall biosynthesis
MRVLGFCEGASADTGGVGLTGVPLIHRALGDQGHNDALAVGGDPMPSAQLMLRESIDDILLAPPKNGGAGVVPFRAWGTWSFSPALYRAALDSAPHSDFISLHSMYSFPVLAGYAVSRRFKKPFGLWPHGVFAPVQREVGKAKKSVYDAAIGKRILDDASVLFYSAEGERDEARPLGLKAPSVVIPHGMDPGRFADLPARGAFRQKYMGGYRGPLVLYLGRLNVKKGLDLLVESMAIVVREIPDVRLAIAGSGHPASFTAQVQEWITQAGTRQSTVVTGPLDEDDKLAAFSDCDVFVLPSAAENFGFAMFEAMASGRALVCSDTLNYAAEISGLGAGIAAKRTARDFAGAVAQLLSSPERRATMGQNGQRLARSYSWESCGRRLEIAIQSILTGEPFPSELKPESAMAHGGAPCH